MEKETTIPEFDITKISDEPTEKAVKIMSMLKEKIFIIENYKGFGLPEIMLVGLQKFHREEFGYNYDTKEGKDEAFEKVSQLVDDYFDGEDADFKGLFNSLEEELLHNGFLSSMFNEEQESQNKEQKKAQSRAKKSTEN